MTLTFIITLLVLTFVNYLIGALITGDFNIKDWERYPHWVAFITSEGIMLIGSIVLSAGIYNFIH